MRHNTADPLTPDADGLRVATAVRAGEISAREAVEAAIARIEITDARFSFMVAERFEQALSEADRVDRSAPLAGVPMLTKDFLATVEGLTLTECSRFIPGWIPNRDCEYVARLKRAGAIILGSVTSSELAILSSCQTRRYGITRNPRALDRTTGGSSGGSGAAVAAGAVAVAHGSDAGGSIRMPAACCGVIGLKPTRGRNPLGPDYGDLGNGTWAEHVLTRSVRDSAALLDATSGPAPGDPYQAPPPHRSFLAATEAEPRRMRVAISPTLPNGMALHPDSAAALERAAVVLGELRHEVIEGNPKFDVSGADHDFFTLFSAGLAARVSMWSQRLGHEPSDTDLEPYTWHLLRRGRESTAEELVGAMTRLQYTSREIADFYESVDLWVTPTLGIPPFPLGYLEPGPDLDSEEVERRDSIFTAFTWPSNMTGQPALSFPLHETADGVPIGVQITGRFGDEDAVLGLAASLEAQMLRVQATPPMVGQ